MRKLANFELANVAMWSFDYDRASSLFNSVIEDFSEKTDLLGTLGAIESSIVMRESTVVSWEPDEQDIQEAEISKPYLKIPSTSRVEERDRVKRFESIISKKEKDILRDLQKQRLRLRDKLIREIPHEMAGTSATGQLTKRANGPWFIAVHRLASICVGRAYRRDGSVPEILSVHRTLQGTGFMVNNSDDRCIVISKDGLAIEMWFDGRVCCTAASERSDDVLAALELMTKVSDSALAIDSK